MNNQLLVKLLTNEIELPDAIICAICHWNRQVWLGEQGTNDRLLAQEWAKALTTVHFPIAMDTS